MATYIPVKILRQKVSFSKTDADYYRYFEHHYADTVEQHSKAPSVSSYEVMINHAIERAIIMVGNSRKR